LVVLWASSTKRGGLKMEIRKMRYIQFSDFFKYFLRDRETGLFNCKICAEDGIETICLNRTRHIREQHRSIYLAEKERLRKERELYEIELWGRTTGMN
jgi:hypothetical protein